ISLPEIPIEFPRYCIATPMGFTWHLSTPQLSHYRQQIPHYIMLHKNLFRYLNN
ncbi:hypothetical protein L9F63_011949, partial [Diploptera punctata]